MHFEPNHLYHLSGKTFMRTLAFPKPANYHYFIDKLEKLNSLCRICCYCLLPDEFHLIVYFPVGSAGLPRTRDDQMQRFCRTFGKMLSSYTRAFNRQELRRGSLFQPRTRSKMIDIKVRSEFEHIHALPVTKGFVFRPGDWEFSSSREYQSGGTGLCDKGLTAQLLGLDQIMV